MLQPPLIFNTVFEVLANSDNNSKSPYLVFSQLMKKKNDTGEDQSQAKSEKVFGENAEKYDIWRLVE